MRSASAVRIVRFRLPRRVSRLAIIAMILLSNPRPAVDVGPALAAAVTDDAPLLRPIDHAFGDTRAVALAGDVAYYGSGRSLIAVDVTDVRAPRPIGQSAWLPTTVWNAAAPPAFRDLAADPGSGVVWVITGDPDDGVMAYDVRDPTRPRLRGVLTGLWRPVAIAAAGRDVVVATRNLADDGTGSVLLVGGPSLDAPAVLAEEPDLAVEDVAVNGDVVVAAGWTVQIAQLAIVPDGGRRRLVAGGHLLTTPRDGSFNQVSVVGCRAYSGHPFSGTVAVYDVCAPVGPRRLGHVNVDLAFVPAHDEPTPGAMAAASINGSDRLFFANDFGDVFAADVPDPPNGAVSGRVLHTGVAPLPLCFPAVATGGDRVAVVSCGLKVGWVTMADVMDPGRLPTLPGVGSGAPNVRLESAAGLLYAQAGGVLSVIDPRPEGSQAILGQYGLTDPLWGPAWGWGWSNGDWGLAVAGSTAWIAADSSSPVIGVDVSHPDRMTTIGPLPGLEGTGPVAADGDLVVASDSSVPGIDLKFFDVADPRKPRLLAALPNAGTVTHATLRLRAGRLLVVDGGVAVLYDLARPTSPRQMAMNEVGSNAPAEDADLDDELVVASNGEDVSVFASTPVEGRLSLLARVPLAVPRSDIARKTRVRLTTADGRRFAVVVTGDLLRAIDLTDPSRPRPGRIQPLGYMPAGLAVSGDNVFLLGGAGLELARFRIGPVQVDGMVWLPWVGAYGG